MNTCSTTLDPFQAEDSELNVVAKYEELMATTISEDSLYARAKTTYYELFKNLQITESEKAQIVAQNISSMTTSLSANAMQSALAWAKEERDGAYSLAKIKSDTELSIANTELVSQKICTEEKSTALVCAQIEETIAGSIRDNGRVATHAADGCKPETLQDEGLKYQQIKQVQAATYQSFADAYRKSGVVQISEDVQDGVLKGTSGDENGYTWQQIEFSERQRISFEDSKINHAVNSSASMIGQMLTAEIAPADQDVQRWRDAMDRLLQPYTTTPIP